MSDYERIEKAILFLIENQHKPPSLNEIAAHLHLSPFHFQRLFSRWAGVSPKKYLQVLTVQRAKSLLQDSASILDVTESMGLSSSSRLYDHFVQLEAVTPGEFKTKGAGLTIEYSVHKTPFGVVFLATTSRGVCSLSFLQSDNLTENVQRLRNQWPLAILVENFSKTHAIVDSIFFNTSQADRPISLYVSGTNFQINVWKALLRIPAANIQSYSDIAHAIGLPRAARAVGTAMGANPVAFVIPCHRVIQQSGKLGGYRWGETRLHAIHAWESARKSN